MSENPSFDDNPEEAYKNLFAKWQALAADNEVVRGRYAKTAQELLDAKQEIEALNTLAGDHSVVENSGEISILNDNMAAAGNQSSVSKAPVFTGTAESESVFLWVTRLKKLQCVNKWSDEQTLDAATMALKGPAGEWWSYLQRRDKASIDTLEKFLKEFQDQFEETASAAESVKWISNLVQKPNEPGKDFFFRVGNSTFLSCQAALEELKSDAALTTAEQGFNACLNHFSRVLFVNGLKPGVKSIIESKFSSMKDTKSLLGAVVEAEIAAQARGDRVHSLELEISALQKQAKAWQSSSSGSGSSSGPKKGGASQGQASGSSGLTHRQKIAARTKWINCFKCKQWGKHRANECRLSAEKISALTPQSADQTPSGEPKDVQFDTQAKN